jgi:hypothetical protein
MHPGEYKYLFILEGTESPSVAGAVVCGLRELAHQTNTPAEAGSVA